VAHPPDDAISWHPTATKSSKTSHCQESHRKESQSANKAALPPRKACPPPPKAKSVRGPGKRTPGDDPCKLQTTAKKPPTAARSTPCNRGRRPLKNRPPLILPGGQHHPALNRSAREFTTLTANAQKAQATVLPLGAADEQKPAAEGSPWKPGGPSASTPGRGCTASKMGLGEEKKQDCSGASQVLYLPPLLETLGLWSWSTTPRTICVPGQVAASTERLAKMAKKSVLRVPGLKTVRKNAARGTIVMPGHRSGSPTDARHTIVPN